MTTRSVFFLVCMIFMCRQTVTAQQWRNIVTESFDTGSGANTRSQTPASNISPGTTDYTPLTGTSGSGPADGQYMVATSSIAPATSTNKSWIIQRLDHTPGDVNGYMMVINANPARQGEANGTYYLYSTKAFDVPGATYSIDFWSANLLTTTANGAKEAYIGLAVRDGVASGTSYGSGSWILPRTTNNNVLPWVNRQVTFSLPLSYAGNALNFNFYNTDNTSGTNGNDFVLDDITIKMQVITLSGKVFSDANANGVQDSGEPGIDGTATPVYAYVTKADGTIISKVQVAQDGSYIFSNDEGVPLIPSSNGDIGMKLLISSRNSEPGDSITSSEITGYGHVSENTNGSSAASPGAVNGIMNLTNTSEDISNINFGIKQYPESYDVTKQIAGAPEPGQPVSLADTPFRGSEGGTGDQPSSWTGKPVAIESLPSNGFELYYDGVKINDTDIGPDGYVIQNFDPSKLFIQATENTPGGTSSTAFTYSVIDETNLKDPTPATFSVEYSQALPVTFGNLSATIGPDGILTANWTTLTENGNDHFEIEVSADGKKFAVAGTLKSQAPNGDSNTPLKYIFTKSMTGLAGLMLTAGLLISLAGGSCNRRRRRQLSCLLILAITLNVCSCQRSKDTVNLNGTYYVRIAQVDQDGKKTYSKTVVATTNNREP
ncbi:SdrD B-like domain-containing protein [Niabella beijingensis]|uniref:SdrD B-like domain-containing protein n=1 Tax=Niabella beijingensis TaxID=2872700 RepID=UPI001CBFEC74|nr:SdrD B-like domain-containing protein [Niabella beijingensis]MBZ4192444.1 hypothetical protein [Niabella beijingensis]